MRMRFRFKLKTYFLFPFIITMSIICYIIIPIPMNKVENGVVITIPSRFTGVFDDTGEYKTFHFVIVPEFQNNYLHMMGKLCVAIQASFDRLYQIVDFLITWDGIISLSVFTVENEYFLALNYLHYLRKCNKAFREQVSVHLTYSIRHPPNNYSLKNFECSIDSRFVYKELLDSRNATSNIAYPQNLLRNIARRNCQNEYILCPDIDMILTPSYQYLNNFLSQDIVRNCNKCAYVIPVYEIQDNCETLPKNKSELLKFIKSKSARQYHKIAFAKNQGQSKLDKWEKLDLLNNSEINIAYDISFRFWYEPIYISRRGSPKFDERYVGFGMVRNTQVLEMALKGYQFKLLDNIFLSHWGFQTDKHSEERNKQTNRNFLLFVQTHLGELAIRYNSDPENLLAKYEKYTKKHDIVAVKLNKTIKDEKKKSKP